MFRHFVALALAMGAMSSLSFSQNLMYKLYGIDGDVNAIDIKGNTAYIGGVFRHVGFSSGQTAMVDSANGKPVVNFPRCDGAGDQIFATLQDGNGGWYIGGIFLSCGGYPLTNFAHIRADQTVDTSLNLQLDGAVRALALSGDTLYIGGSFTSVKGQARNYLASVLASTKQVTSWDPNPNYTVTAILPVGDSVYIAGGFSQVGPAGHTAQRLSLASVRQISGFPGAWNPNLTVYNFPNTAMPGLVQMNGIIYVAGDFLRSGATARDGVAAFSASTGALTPWDPGSQITALAGKRFFSIVGSGNKIYIAGSFNAFNGITRNDVLAVDTAGQLLPWNPNPDNVVESMSLDGRTMYLGGVFVNVGGTPHPYAAAVDTDGTVRSWSPLPDFEVTKVAAVNGRVVLGGQFTWIDYTPRVNAAAFDLTTGKPTAWNPAPDSPVHALKVAGANIALGGEFAHVGGAPRPHLAFVDDSLGNSVIPIPDPGALVSALGVLNGTLYVGGGFTTPRNYLEAINIADGTLTNWAPYANELVSTIAILGSNVYVAGFFDTVGTVRRSGLACIDAITGGVSGWNPQPSGTVFAIAPTTSAIYIGGRFTTVGGTANRQYLAAIDPSTGSPLAWNPGADGFVNALVATDALVVAGGQYATIGGVPRRNLSGLNPSTGTPTAWDPGISSLGVTSLASSGNTLLLGGPFFQAAHTAALHFTGFTETPLTSVAPDGGTRSLPSTIGLIQNYPNPFNPSTLIRYVVAGSMENGVGSTEVKLVVYDLLGREVAVLVNERKMPGSYEVKFDASGLASGVYLYRLNGGQFVQTRKMVVLK